MYPQLMGPACHGEKMDACFSIGISDYFIQAYGRFAVLITYELAGPVIEVHTQGQINGARAFFYFSIQQGQVGLADVVVQKLLLMMECTMSLLLAHKLS